MPTVVNRGSDRRLDGELEDSLLEFVAQVAARALAREFGLLPDEESESDSRSEHHEQSRRLRPLLH